MKNILVALLFLAAGSAAALEFSEKDLKSNNFAVKIPAESGKDLPIFCTVTYTAEKPVEIIFKPVNSVFRYRTKRLPAAKEAKTVTFSMRFFTQSGIETIVEIKSKGAFDFQKFQLVNEWQKGHEQYLNTMVPDPARKRNPRHKAIKNDYSKAGKNPVVLFGDSLTDNWRGEHFARMKEIFGGNGIVNAGICGDRIEHLLWRMNDMAEMLKANPPSVAVFFIGTNNSGGNTADEILYGMENLVRTLRGYCPQTKVIVLGLAPRGLAFARKALRHIDPVNVRYRTLADWKDVYYYEFSNDLMNPDDRALKMDFYTNDALHFSGKGYAEVITPNVAGMIKLVQSPKLPADFFRQMDRWQKYLQVRYEASLQNPNLEEQLCCEAHLKDLPVFWRKTLDSVLADPGFVPVLPPEYLRQQKEEGLPSAVCPE